MKKDEFIAKYGEEAYKMKLARNRELDRARYRLNREKMQEKSRKYRAENPAKVKAANKRYYEEHREELIARMAKWHEANLEQKREKDRNWYKTHPETVKAGINEVCRKGGKRYDKHLLDNRTGLQGARNRIRAKHRGQYKPYKDIIAPDSQIHHEWIEKTAKHRGLALVETKPHQYGIIDVIQILDGEITLLTEEEVKQQQERV